MLREIHVDQAFLATHSVSVKAGLTYPSFEEVDAKRAMIAAARDLRDVSENRLWQIPPGAQLLGADPLQALNRNNLYK